MQLVLMTRFHAQILVVAGLALITSGPTPFGVTADSTDGKAANKSGFGLTSFAFIGSAAGIVVLVIGVGVLLHQHRSGQIEGQQRQQQQQTPNLFDQSVKKHTTDQGAQYNGDIAMVDMTNSSPTLEKLPYTTSTGPQRGNNGDWLLTLPWAKPNGGSNHNRHDDIETGQLDANSSNQHANRRQHKFDGPKISIDVARGFDAADVEAPGVPGDLSPTPGSFDVVHHHPSRTLDSGRISPIPRCHTPLNNQRSSTGASRDSMQRWADETISEGFSHKQDDNSDDPQTSRNAPLNHATAAVSPHHPEVHQPAARRPLQNLPQLHSADQLSPDRERDTEAVLPPSNIQSRFADIPTMTAPTPHNASQNTYQLEQSWSLVKPEGEDTSDSPDDEAQSASQANIDRGSYRVW